MGRIYSSIFRTTPYAFAFAVRLICWWTLHVLQAKHKFACVEPPVHGGQFPPVWHLIMQRPEVVSTWPNFTPLHALVCIESTWQWETKYRWQPAWLYKRPPRKQFSVLLPSKLRLLGKITILHFHTNYSLGRFHVTCRGHSLLASTKSCRERMWTDDAVTSRTMIVVCKIAISRCRVEAVIGSVEPRDPLHRICH